MSSKSKKILIVLNIILGLLVLVNTAWLAFITWTFNDMGANFYSYYPFLQPSGNYLNIDDVGYISYDSAKVDEEKLKNGEEIRIYTEEEVMAILAAASEQ